MRFLAKKMAEKFENSTGANPFQGFENTATNPREGEVSIDKNPTSKKENEKVVGEYIEYEEID